MCFKQACLLLLWCGKVSHILAGFLAKKIILQIVLLYEVSFKPSSFLLVSEANSTCCKMCLGKSVVNFTILCISVKITKFGSKQLVQI